MTSRDSCRKYPEPLKESYKCLRSRAMGYPGQSIAGKVQHTLVSRDQLKTSFSSNYLGETLTNDVAQVDDNKKCHRCFSSSSKTSEIKNQMSHNLIHSQTAGVLLHCSVNGLENAPHHAHRSDLHLNTVVAQQCDFRETHVGKYLDEIEDELPEARYVNALPTEECKPNSTRMLDVSSVEKHSDNNVSICSSTTDAKDKQTLVLNGDSKTLNTNVEIKYFKSSNESQSYSIRPFPHFKQRSQTLIMPPTRPFFKNPSNQSTQLELQKCKSFMSVIHRPLKVERCSSVDLKILQTNEQSTSSYFNTPSVQPLKIFFGSKDEIQVSKATQEEENQCLSPQSKHLSNDRTKKQTSSGIQRIQEQLRLQMENDEKKCTSICKTLTIPTVENLQHPERKESPGKKDLTYSDRLQKEEKPYRHWHRMSRVVTAESRFIISPMLSTHIFPCTKLNKYPACRSQGSSTSEGKTKSLAAERETTSIAPEDKSESLSREGKTKSLIPEGKAELLAPEGKIVSLIPEGKIVSLMPEGKIESLMPEGKIESLMPEGKIVSLMPEGKIESLMPERKIASLMPEGKIVSLMPEGKIESLMPEGKIESLMPEGKMESLMPEGKIVSLMPEGKIESLMPERKIASLMPEGKIVSLMPEGKIESLAPEGKTESLSQEGKIESLSREGKIESLSREGKIESLAPEGKTKADLKTETCILFDSEFDISNYSSSLDMFDTEQISGNKKVETRSIKNGTRVNELSLQLKEGETENSEIMLKLRSDVSLSDQILCSFSIGCTQTESTSSCDGQSTTEDDITEAEKVESQTTETSSESGLNKWPPLSAGPSIPRYKSFTVKSLPTTKYQRLNEVKEVGSPVNGSLRRGFITNKAVDKLRPLNSVSGVSQVMGPSFSEHKNKLFLEASSKKRVNLGPKLRTAERSLSRIKSPALTAGSSGVNIYLGTDSQATFFKEPQGAVRNVPRNISMNSTHTSIKYSSEEVHKKMVLCPSRICPNPTAGIGMGIALEKDCVECINRNWSSDSGMTGETMKESAVSPSKKQTHKVFLADVASKLIQKVNRAGLRAPWSESTQKYMNVKATQDYKGSLPGQLSFPKGQTIKQRCLSGGPSDGMSYGYYRVGRLRKKRKGLFPSNFVTTDVLNGWDVSDKVSLTSSSKSAI